MNKDSKHLAHEPPAPHHVSLLLSLLAQLEHKLVGSIPCWDMPQALLLRPSLDSWLLLA